MSCRSFRKERRHLSTRGPTQDANISATEMAYLRIVRNRTADVNISATEMAAVLSERQQLRTELANARDQIDLLELQTSCNFSAAQIQKIESACGVKRVTAEALISGACE